MNIMIYTNLVSSISHSIFASIMLITSINIKDQIGILEKEIPNWMLHHGLKIIVLLVAGYLLHQITKRIIHNSVKITVVGNESEEEEEVKKREDTLIRILVGTAKVLIILGIATMILKEMGILVGPMLAGLGIVGLAFGFGGQYLIRDIITGLFIIMENQYRIGDLVKIDTRSGIVEDISLRKTILRDIDGTVHYIPHGDIKGVSNLSRNFSRMSITLTVPSDSDLEKIIQWINTIGQEIMQTPYWQEVVIKAPKFIRIDEFIENAVVLRINAETEPMRHTELAGELRKRLKEKFDCEKINIYLPTTAKT